MLWFFIRSEVLRRYKKKYSVKVRRFMRRITWDTVFDVGAVKPRELVANWRVIKWALVGPLFWGVPYFTPLLIELFNPALAERIIRHIDTAPVSSTIIEKWTAAVNYIFVEFINTRNVSGRFGMDNITEFNLNRAVKAYEKAVAEPTLFEILCTDLLSGVIYVIFLYFGVVCWISDTYYGVIKPYLMPKFEAAHDVAANIVTNMVKKVDHVTFYVTEGKDWTPNTFLRCGNSLDFLLEINLGNFKWVLAHGTTPLTLCLLILTKFILILCVILQLEFFLKQQESFQTTLRGIFLLCFLGGCIILSFRSFDILEFYIAFESALIPLMLLILLNGSRPRKIKATFYLFFFTFVSSLCLLVGIIYLYALYDTTNYLYLMTIDFSLTTHKILFILFFIPFAVKVPMLPFHIWLPEAHVEAPTVGSILLASILLKLGTFGFIRYNVELFYVGAQIYAPYVQLLAALGVVYASFATIRQIDLKRIIAYSSIAHMNLMVMGIFTLQTLGLNGAIYLMVGHAFVSTGLFLTVGLLYDRQHTRLIRYYGGLNQYFPHYTFCFLIFTLGNMGFPGTCNFVGEICILLSIFQKAPLAAFFAGTGIICSAIYSIWLYNRVFFGAPNIAYLKASTPATMIEKIILSILCVFVIYFGINTTGIFGLNAYATFH